MTLDEIVRRNALRFARKPALIADSGACTWAELNERVDRLTHALRGRGLERGDRVAILLGNCAEYFELYFACARGGFVAVPLNFRLNAEEARQILAHADPRILVAGQTYADAAARLRAEQTGIQALWIVGGEANARAVAASTAADSYEAALAAADAAPIPPQAQEQDCFAIFFTSGTTGLPKGAMVSHLNLEANSFNQFVADGSRADDINLVATPVYHMGAVFMAVTYMMLGCTQVILPQFSPPAWLAALARHRATVSLLIPTMINALLNDPSFAGADRGSLRLIFYGGGPMPAAVLERMLRGFSCGFTQGYGLTETLEATFLVASDHVLSGTDAQRRRLASCGREAVGAEVRIVGDDGADVATNLIGEILIRSRSVICGYWRQPELTPLVTRGDWFCTGDLGYLDEDRYLFVVDRKTDMVVTGGVNVYTKEVESVLYQHEDVREAAVFGIPDDQWGEMLTAAVAVHEGGSATDAELIDFCKERLAGFKCPKRVVFLPELPKNPSGKILKRELRRMVPP
jgi:long-chain acyl-CoA synthetase